MRIIKRFAIGDDVLAVKQKLVELGYLAKATTKMFGNDSYKAVKEFQERNNLEADGIVGPITYAALFEAKEPEESVSFDIPSHIGSVARGEISRALAKVSSVRREICLDALQFATDPDVKNDSMKGFYVRGGNLYDKDLSLHKMSDYRLKKYFAYPQYAPYYDNGRQEVMQDMAKKANYEIPGCDCSGFIVGLWRKHKVVAAEMDATANGLYNSYCVKTDKPQPGDLAWKSGHIGLVVCDSPLIVCESAGGEFGIQLTKASNRKAYSFTRKKLVSLGKWTAYGDPKKY